MSDGKRHYIPPKVIRQPADAQYLAFLKNENKTHSKALGGKLSSHWNSHQQYVTVVDHERRYIEVSDDFCKLVGYERDDLLAKKYDDLRHSWIILNKANSMPLFNLPMSGCISTDT